MTVQPLISAIMLCYNAAPYVEEAVCCVMRGKGGPGERGSDPLTTRPAFRGHGARVRESLEAVSSPSVEPSETQAAGMGWVSCRHPTDLGAVH